jgi:hypothetical protein
MQEKWRHRHDGSASAIEEIESAASAAARGPVCHS